MTFARGCVPNPHEDSAHLPGFGFCTREEAVRERARCDRNEALRVALKASVAPVRKYSYEPADTSQLFNKWSKR
jgi:hypothetical protein